MVGIEHDKLLFDTIIEDLGDDNLKSGHTLIELSTNQWKRYRNNSIIVRGIKEEKQSKNNIHLKYSNVVFGNKLHLKSRSGKCKGTTMRWKSPILQNISGGYCMIVGDKKEILLHYPNLIIMDGGGTQDENDTENHRNGSGYLILFFGRLQRQTGISKYVWGGDKLNIVKECKTNVIKGNSSHHGSSGNYFSFGNRANYGKINNSSITQYVPKKYMSVNQSIISMHDAELMEKIVGRELELSIMYLSKLIPKLNLYIAPVISVANEIQHDIGNCNIKEMECSNSGLWNCSLCISCQTEELHTENDFTYTVITTPAQENTDVVVNFLFELQEKSTIGIQLDPGLSFIFSGKYLTHRQVIDDRTKNNGDFVNIASYGNQRLYNHIKTTINRICD